MYPWQGKEWVKVIGEMAEETSVIVKDTYSIREKIAAA